MSAEPSLSLSDAIEELRAELTCARARASGAEIQFPIRGVTVELHMVAIKAGEGRAGFKVPIVDLELGTTGTASHETSHKVVIEFGEPVDAGGTAVRVDHLSDAPLD